MTYLRFAMGFSTKVRHGLAAMLLTLLMVLGQAAPEAGPRMCPHCDPHCPMRTARLKCHERGARTPCHAAGTRWTGASCMQGSAFHPLAGDPALPLPPMAVTSRAPHIRRLSTESTSLTQATLEPPTDPPRRRFAA